jgi:hypothetical protein
MEHESELAMVRRHVADGERIVAGQLDLIDRMAARGHSTRAAEQLLQTFEALLRQHREHLARIS